MGKREDENPDDVDEEVDDDTEEDEDEDTKSKEPRKFTQKEVSATAAKEKREGRKQGRANLVKELGLESEDELHALVEKAKKTSSKDKKQDEDEGEELASERALRKKAEDEARISRMSSRAAMLLIDEEGAQAKGVGRIVKLLNLEKAKDDDDIRDEIEGVKDSFPELFTDRESEEDEAPDDEDQGSEERRRRSKGTKSASSRPGGQPSPQRRKRSERDRAVEDRLQKRHGTKLQVNKK